MIRKHFSGASRMRSNQHRKNHEPNFSKVDFPLTTLSSVWRSKVRENRALCDSRALSTEECGIWIFLRKILYTCKTHLVGPGSLLIWKSSFQVPIFDSRKSENAMKLNIRQEFKGAHRLRYWRCKNYITQIPRLYLGGQNGPQLVSSQYTGELRDGITQNA